MGEVHPSEYSDVVTLVSTVSLQVVETSPAQFFCPDSRARLVGEGRWGYLDYQYMHHVIRQEKLGNVKGKELIVT